MKRFAATMRRFKQYCPEYGSHTVRGAVAYLRDAADAAVFAESRGLFVIRATGDSASIINKPGFTPRIFA